MKSGSPENTMKAVRTRDRKQGHRRTKAGLEYGVDVKEVNFRRLSRRYAVEGVIRPKRCVSVL